MTKEELKIEMKKVKDEAAIEVELARGRIALLETENKQLKDMNDDLAKAAAHAQQKNTILLDAVTKLVENVN